MMRSTPWRRGPSVEALEARELLASVQAAPLPSVISTEAPQVAYVQFEPLTGRILVQYSNDPAGYDPAVLTNPANYSFSLVQSFARTPARNESRPRAGVVLGPPYEITGVTLTVPIEPGVAPSVIVSINNNQPLRFGIYQFAIQSPGLVDLDGRPLNGTYSGTFPSGDSLGGGDFVAILAETNSTVLPALPTTPPTGPSNPLGIVPTYVFLPTTRGVRVRYTSATPGKFVLAGGNKITLVPLAYQYFPGTFRLPKLDPTLIPGVGSKT